jgi:hypothetical protein
MQGEHEGIQEEKANKQDLQYLHQQGGQKYSYTILNQEEEKGKVIAIKANKGKGENLFGCLRISSPTWKAQKRFGSGEGSEMFDGLQGIWRLGKK